MSTNRKAASITKSWVEGYEAFILENPLLQVVVIPALGGRIWELEDRVRERQWIWHRPDVPLTYASPGAVYDDVWAGGWEELFPNDAPGEFEGRKLPDHGEWWAMSWEVLDSRDGEIVELVLAARSSIVKAECRKVIRLNGDSAALSIEYTVRSSESQPFHFLFKQHLPIQINPDCRLILPGGVVEAVDIQFSTILPGVGPYAWPVVADGSGQTIDLRCIPPASSRTKEFLYVKDLPESWCSVADTRSGAALRMDFDAEQLPYVWLFLSYGGWRDLYTAVLEPCTNLPKELAEAVRLEQAARLDPGDEFKTAVTVTLGVVDVQSYNEISGEHS